MNEMEVFTAGVIAGANGSLTPQQQTMIGKAQYVRLIDVLALGPFMMWTSTCRGLPPWARTVMWWSGAATIVYNGRNYLRILEATRGQANATRTG